jgi:hypothetical protein
MTHTVSAEVTNVKKVTKILNTDNANDLLPESQSSLNKQNDAQHLIGKKYKTSFLIAINFCNSTHLQSDEEHAQINNFLFLRYQYVFQWIMMMI